MDGEGGFILDLAGAFAGFTPGGLFAAIHNQFISFDFAKGGRHLFAQILDLLHDIVERLPQRVPAGERCLNKTADPVSQVRRLLGCSGFKADRILQRRYLRAKPAGHPFELRKLTLFVFQFQPVHSDQRFQALHASSPLKISESCR